VSLATATRQDWVSISILRQNDIVSMASDLWVKRTWLEDCNVVVS